MSAATLPQTGARHAGANCSGPTLCTRLSPASQQALIDFGLRSVLDLRKSREMQEKRNAFFGSDQGVTYYHQNMVGDTLIREREDIPKGLDYVEHMRWSYSVVLDRRKSHIHDTLVLLSQEGTLPALVHCAGGTERTGLIVGLVLGIVGVPEHALLDGNKMAITRL
jgi:protein-tyrosine phosphatase